MLSNKDMYLELDKIEAVLDELEKAGKTEEWAKLKATTLNVKLLHNLRTNMVTVMKHLGIELKPSTKRDDRA